MPALLELANVLRVLEAQPAQADAAVIDAVAVEVDDVVGLPLAAGTVEFLAQGRQRGRAEDVDPDQAGQGFHGLDQRQRTGAVIDVAAGVVLRPRGDEQDADGGGDDRHVARVCGRDPAADTGGLGALEEVTLTVVKQLPGQTEQQRGGFPGGLYVSFGRAGFSAVSTWTEKRRPAWSSIFAQAFMTFSVGHGHRPSCRSCSPLYEVRLHFAGAILEIVARPDGVFLQIPAQLRPRSDRWAR